MKKILKLIIPFGFLIFPGTVLAYSPIPLASNYGFGYIQTTGEGFSHLVTPGFAVAGTLLVIYFVLGAFRYITAMGDKEDAKAGRERITHAIVGFIILIMLFLGLKFFPDILGLQGISLIK